MNDTVDLDSVLAEAAQATEAAGKKVRQPKGTTGEAAAPKVREPKAPKEPKEKLYVQWNEDGSPMLDADGNRVKGPVKVERPKVARQPKLDADGNPITRSRVIPCDDTSTITWNEEKVSKYKGARADFAAMRTDGQTIASYVAAGGDKGFLRFYVRDGAAVVTAPAAAE